jgi:hypothetical protein
MEGDFEAVGVAGVAHRLEALGQAFGVAVVAARADPVTAGDRVPGCLCPFDVGPIPHGLAPPTVSNALLTRTLVRV